MVDKSRTSSNELSIKLALHINVLMGHLGEILSGVFLAFVIVKCSRRRQSESSRVSVLARTSAIRMKGNKTTLRKLLT